MKKVTIYFVPNREWFDESIFGRTFIKLKINERKKNEIEKKINEKKNIYKRKGVDDVLLICMNMKRNRI